MSKHMSPEDLGVVLQALARLPHGGSLAEIEEVLVQKVARRTLQRHLAFLVQQGKVFAEGQRRGRRYKLVSMPVQPESIALLKQSNGFGLNRHRYELVSSAAPLSFREYLSLLDQKSQMPLQRTASYFLNQNLFNFCQRTSMGKSSESLQNDSQIFWRHML